MRSRDAEAFAATECVRREVGWQYPLIAGQSRSGCDVRCDLVPVDEAHSLNLATRPHTAQNQLVMVESSLPYHAAIARTAKTTAAAGAATPATPRATRWNWYHTAYF